MPTFEQTAKGYKNLWLKAAVKPEHKAEAMAAAKTIIAANVPYSVVENKTGVPWYWIGCTHYRESTFNWNRSLGQGDPWNRVSTHEPKGRGPFKSWEAAAIDSLVTLKHLDQIKEWPVERMLFEFERYNGQGYFGKGENSPYVWAGTTIEQDGKYVADRKYDPNYHDKQVGCAAILKCLCELDRDIADEVNGKVVQLPQPAPVPPPELAPKPVPPPVPSPPKRNWLIGAIIDFIRAIANK